MSKARSKRKQPSSAIALEVSRNDLTMVIADYSRGTPRIRGQHMVWRQESTSLNSEDGIRELTAALKTLVTNEKQAGASIRVALSSDFCVTRVVAGESEAVADEIRELRERSAHYLWLGAGNKAVAESCRSIDAKQIQTWLTITNEDTLNNIVRVAEQAGLHVDLVEHSMVALCRAVGNMGRDTESPVIIVELNENGLDLGVSYRGNLLFDYRPGGIDCKERTAEIVGRHLERIQRYCNRFFRFASGKIERVFLSGNAEDIPHVQRQFEACEELTAETLDPRSVCPDWVYDENVTANSHFIGALGCLLVPQEQLELPPTDRGMTDLMDHFYRGRRAPLLPALAKLAWPIAATLLLAVGVFAVAFQENQQAAAVESENATMEMVRARVRDMKFTMENMLTRTDYLRQIDSQLLNPPWNDLISMIGHCLPQGTWLDNVRIDHSGLVSVTGTSATEDTVFEFVRYLKQVPLLTNVNLEAQRPTRVANGRAITFEIKCEYTDFNDKMKRADSHD
jgi:Tfp pilus assembly protein PilN